MEIRAAKAEDQAAVHGLLVDAALPVADLSEAADQASVVDFLVADDGGEVVGVVGLQAFQGVGLLRSLAVHASVRGAGTGGKLVRALEAAACAARMHQLVLLTQTAGDFFARHGYRVIERAAAPAAVQASAEFRALCPASAICMAKSLEPAA